MSSKNTRSGHSPLKEGGKFPYRTYPDTRSESGAGAVEPDKDKGKGKGKKVPLKAELPRRSSIAVPYQVPKKGPILTPSRLTLFNPVIPATTTGIMDQDGNPVPTGSKTAAPSKVTSADQAGRVEVEQKLLRAEKELDQIRKEHQDQLARMARDYES